MFDAHSCLPPPLVRQFAGYLKSDDLLFLEEAWVPGNIENMKKVREMVPVPLATGERDRTIWEVREILEAQVIDVLQPDCGHGGGITQMKKVAALAEAHFVPIAPHCTMSHLGLTASLHVAASVPMFLIHEGYAGVLPEDVAIKTWEMDDEGYVSLPEGPGLGVEVNEARAIEVGRDPARSIQVAKCEAPGWGGVGLLRGRGRNRLMSTEARKIYDEAIVIDGLSISNWGERRGVQAFAGRQ